MIKYYLFLCVLCLGKLNAKEHVFVDEREDRFTYLPRLIKMNNWNKISQYIDHKKHISLPVLGKIAQYENSKPLARAVNAVKILRNTNTRFHMPKRKLFKTALFLETELSKYKKLNQNYISSKKSKLPFNVEVDQQNKNRFIIFDKKIGEGTKKVVMLSVLYDGKKTQIVARGTQRERDSTTDEIKRELEISKKVCSSPGVVESYGVTKTVVNGKNYHSIYYGYYNKGSLQSIFDRKVKLSLKDKVNIANDIITGLYSIHSKGIAHGDLGARNYLVNISRDAVTKKRVVTACIADLGRANYTSKLYRNKVQGNVSYTSPEALFKSKMEGDAYLKADVYAVGCVLYHLFYGKDAPWRDSKYVNDKDKSTRSRYKSLVHKIDRKTMRRRIFLERQYNSYPSTSPRQELERLVLTMVNPDQDKRGDASMLKKRIDKIKGLVSRKRPIIIKS